MNILKIKKPKSLSGKFRFYPGIKKKIKKNIAQLNLKPLSSIDSFEDSWRQTIKKPKHTLIFRCQYQGIPAIYKALVLNQPVSLWGFEKNIRIAKSLEKILPFFPTKILDYQIKPDFKYVIYQYFDGKSCTLRTCENQNIKLIIKNLLNWQSIPYRKIPKYIKNAKNMGPDGKLARQNSRLDLAWLKFFLSQIDGLFVQDKEVLKYIGKNAKIVDQNRQTLCHGDFTPVNIILDHQKKTVHFIDYEYTRIDHRAWDVANFYFISWENPQIQVQFLKQYLNKIDDKDIFWALFRYQIIFDMIMLAYYSLVEISNQFQKNPNQREKLKILKYWLKCFWHCQQRVAQALNRPLDLLKTIDNNQLAQKKFVKKIIRENFKDKY